MGTLDATSEETNTVKLIIQFTQVEYTSHVDGTDRN